MSSKLPLATLGPRYRPLVLQSDRLPQRFGRAETVECEAGGGDYLVSLLSPVPYQSRLVLSLLLLGHYPLPACVIPARQVEQSEVLELDRRMQPPATSSTSIHATQRSWVHSRPF